jgi:hypothetical protein
MRCWAWGHRRPIVPVGLLFSFGVAVVLAISPAGSLAQGSSSARRPASVRGALTRIGRGAAPGVKGRLVAKYTTANSDTYALPDGHMLTQVFEHPINYRNGAGPWQPLGKTSGAGFNTDLAASPQASIAPDIERNPLGQENESACTLTSTAPTTSACNQLTFKAGYETSSKSALHGLIGFVLPDLHEELIVLNAQLELYAAKTTTTSGVAMGAYRVTTPWTTGATWNTTNGSTPWHTPGGDYANPEKESDAAINSSVGAKTGWTYWYPTRMVQEWYNGEAAPKGQGQPDLGFLLKDVSEGATNNVVTFDGREEREHNPGLTLEWVQRGVGNATNYTQLPIQLSSTQSLAINPASGNLSIHSTDLQIPSKGLAFESARTWNSLSNEAPGYGYGWIDSNARYVQVAASGNVAFTDSSGNTFPFIKEGKSFKTPPGIAATMCEAGSPSPCPASLPSGTSYQLIYTSTGERIDFGHKEGSGSFIYYYVVSVEDSAGDKQTAKYTGSLEYPTSWVDTEKLEVAYTESEAKGYEKITAKTEPSRSTSYVEPLGEDGLYHLTEYTNEHKEKTIYRYGGESYLEGNLLTEITEPGGNITKLSYNSNYQITKIERIASGQKTGPTTTYTYYELGKAPAPCTSNQRGTEVSESGTEKHTIYCTNVLDEVERIVHHWSSTEIVAACSVYNPETASAELEEECETTNYTPASESKTPGGGIAAHYKLPSTGEAIYYTPPTGFEPLKATNAELEEYDIPTPPPTGTPMHETWEKMMSKLHFTEPSPTFVEDRALYANIQEKTSANWSGYLAQSNSQSYKSVTGIFSVPSAVKSEKSCPNATMSAWAGLGGWNSGALSQDGFNVIAGAEKDPVWWEVLPLAELFIKKVHATPGSRFLATTTITGPSSRSFFVYNESTGEAHGFSMNNYQNNDESTADIIPAERLTVNKVATPLLNFTSNTGDGWVNNNTLLENVPLYEVKMHQEPAGGPVLAEPGKISSLFHEFEDKWVRCGEAGV